MKKQTNLAAAYEELTKENFQNWLNQQPPGRIFIRRTACQCPIACWAKSILTNTRKQTHNVAVSTTTINITRYDKLTTERLGDRRIEVLYFMPEWIYNFVIKVDNGSEFHADEYNSNPYDITAEECQRILNHES